MVSLYIWITTLCFISRNIIDTMASPILSIYHRARKSQKPHRFISSHQGLHKFFTKLERANFFHATNSFLAEFSEAQCFYAMFIAIAVIYADSQGATFNGATNWPSVSVNQEETNFVSLFGFVPILLVQISLQRASMDSVYSLVISTAAWILIGVAGVATEKPLTISRFHNMMKKDGMALHLEECGGNLSLRALCDGLGVGILFIDESSYVWYWSPMLLYLWCVKSREHLLRMGRLFFAALINKASKRRNVAWTKAILALKKHLWFWRRFITLFLLYFAYCYLLYMMVFLVVLVVQVLRASYGDDSDRPWGLGQVIALLVWVPVLAKYLYTLVCKFGLYFTDCC